MSINLDLDAARESARHVTDLTDSVCGSTSLNELQAHLAALEDQRDALYSNRNTVLSQINALRDQERELKRWEKKVEDHHKRVKGAFYLLRYSSPHA